MRAFPHPNMTNFTCPICGTSADKPVVLVPIQGTEDGGTCEAKQVHEKCYNLALEMQNSK